MPFGTRKGLSQDPGGGQGSAPRATSPRWNPCRTEGAVWCRALSARRTGGRCCSQTISVPDGRGLWRVAVAVDPCVLHVPAEWPDGRAYCLAPCGHL